MRADGWGQLTDDDLDMIEGESEKLVGALQTRYGWSREEAKREPSGSLTMRREE